MAGAERAWLVAERLAPRSPAGPTNLALAYARAGRWPEAKAAARRALDRDPGDQRAAAVLEVGRWNLIPSSWVYPAWTSRWCCWAHPPRPQR